MGGITLIMDILFVKVSCLLPACKNIFDWNEHPDQSILYPTVHRLTVYTTHGGVYSIKSECEMKLVCSCINSYNLDYMEAAVAGAGWVRYGILSFSGCK